MQIKINNTANDLCIFVRLTVQSNVAIVLQSSVIVVCVVCRPSSSVTRVYCDKLVNLGSRGFR